MPRRLEVVASKPRLRLADAKRGLRETGIPGPGYCVFKADIHPRAWKKNSRKLAASLGSWHHACGGTGYHPPGERRKGGVNADERD